MKKNIVTHSGLISKIEGNNVEVMMMVTSACASCEIKGACVASEMEEKSVSVAVEDSSIYKINQPVTVEMMQSMGTWAVLLGYVFPFLVLFICLIILLQLGVDQGIAGIISLLILVPYYFTIYFFRDYLGKKFHYNIRT